MTIAEMLVEVGEWDEAERLLPGEDRRFLGSELVYVELIRAELNLGRGRHDEAAAHLARLATRSPRRPSRSGTARTARCSPSCAAARATSTARAPRSTTRSTGSSSAPRTPRASPAFRPPA